MALTNNQLSATATIQSAPKSHLKDGIIDLVAGTFGGIAYVYSSQPLDTVKVKMQTFPTLYSNWAGCLKATFKLDGIRGLYAGTPPALVANIFENSVLFTAYGYCQKVVSHLNGTDLAKMSPLQHALSGGLAGIVSSFVLCPTELIKCRLQAQREMNPCIRSTSISICRQMFKRKGLMAFTNGMVPTLVREIPGCFLFFGTYEMSRNFLAQKGQNKNEIGLLKTAISGALSGVILWIACFPADVVKSRMQIQGGTVKSVTKTLLKTEGVAGFYRGLTPTLIKTCIGSASLFIAYENTKKILHSSI